MTEFRNKLAWDMAAGEVRDGPVRYILIRADGLMGLFDRLPEPARREALNAFKLSISEFGGRSARRYHEARKANDPDVLALVAAGAPQLGWGHWTIETDRNPLAVVVRNSPFATGGDGRSQPRCAPIAGMLQATASLALDRPMRAEETCCAAQGGDICRFELRPVGGG